MKSILVLAQSYPSPNNVYSLAFIHSRNLEYIKNNIKVTVLNFSTKNSYEYEGVSVISPKVSVDFDQFDAVVSHAPNLRNHLFLILRNYSKIKKIVFVFHGHEVLFLNKYYPEPYLWEKNNESPILRWLYDHIKLKAIKYFLKANKVSLIYVSEWMKEQAHKCLNINYFSKEAVVYNPINYSFYNRHYSYKKTNEFSDFITIRPLNGSKYAVDLVVALAKVNPNFTFDIYGKGDYFLHNNLPKNVRHIDKFVPQSEIPNLLDNYRGAVMPTRLDAQGVMMCEMASYGIPTIVSDLKICHEMLDGFSNVYFIPNDFFSNKEINDFSLMPLENFEQIERFNPEKLALKELNFILS
ncbi:glycosyltransferase family 4 protein [Acinetobacter baumannii]|nr:glycosyltransferase family 4 protein [Acinetobacter baumannii]